MRFALQRLRACLRRRLRFASDVAPPPSLAFSGETAIDDPILQFEVVGRPAPQGSKSLARLRNGRTVMIDASKRLRPWRNSIAAAAVEAGATVTDAPVSLVIVARYSHAVSHRRADGAIKASVPIRPAYADADKLARAVCDALTGVAYRDDRQVARLLVERVWCKDGESEGAIISMSLLT